MFVRVLERLHVGFEQVDWLLQFQRRQNSILSIHMRQGGGSLLEVEMLDLLRRAMPLASKVNNGVDWVLDQLQLG